MLSCALAFIHASFMCEGKAEEDCLAEVGCILFLPQRFSHMTT